MGVAVNKMKVHVHEADVRVQFQNSWKLFRSIIVFLIFFYLTPVLGKTVLNARKKYIPVLIVANQASAWVMALFAVSGIILE